MPSLSRTQEIEHDIGHAGRFALRVTSPDVSITGTDGTTARVRVRYEIRSRSDVDADEALRTLGFEVTRGDGWLEVAEPRHGDSIPGVLARALGGNRSHVESVEVEIPRGATVEYSGVSADLTARGLSGQQAYRTVSGDIVVDGGGGAIRVQAVSADVSIRADQPVGLDAKTVSGDLSVFTPSFDSTRAVSVSGDVELEGELAPSGTHRVETVSGDFSLGAVGGLSLEVRGLSTDVDVSLPHRTEGSRDRRRYVVADGSAQVAFSSMSGDVSIGPARRVRTPPAPPVPPREPTPPTPPGVPGPSHDPRELAILQALERGEIDVDEAARQLSRGDVT